MYRYKKTTWAGAGMVYAGTLPMEKFARDCGVISCYVCRRPHAFLVHALCVLLCTSNHTAVFLVFDSLPLCLSCLPHVARLYGRLKRFLERKSGHRYPRLQRSLTCTRSRCSSRAPVLLVASSTRQSRRPSRGLLRVWAGKGGFGFG